MLKSRMLKLAEDEDEMTDAKEVVMRRRGRTNIGWQMRLIVQGDTCSVKDLRSGTKVAGAILDVPLPDHVDPELVCQGAIDPTCEFGRLILNSLGGPNDAFLAADVDELLTRDTAYYQLTYTYVSAEDWFEGDELPIDADTSDDEISSIVSSLIQAAWEHGYCDFRRAIIDYEEFFAFLSRARSELKV